MFDVNSPKEKFVFFLYSLISSFFIVIIILSLFYLLSNKQTYNSVSHPIKKSLKTNNKEIKDSLKTKKTQVKNLYSKNNIKSKKNNTQKYYFLNINIVPKTASIRIMNILPKFKQGLKLANGKYHLYITNKGYYPIKKWIEIKNANVTLYEKLKKKK